RPRTHCRLRRCRYCLHDGYFVRGLWLANRRLEESRRRPYCSPTRRPGRFPSFPHHFHKLDKEPFRRLKIGRDEPTFPHSDPPNTPPTLAKPCLTLEVQTMVSLS